MRRKFKLLWWLPMMLAATFVAPARAAAQDPAAGQMARAQQAYQISQQRQAIEENRAGVVADLMNRWSAEIGATERGLQGFQTAFQSSNSEKLLDLTRAQSWDAVRATLLGLKPSNALGDLNADLVFNPVTPCRVFDSRFGTGPFAGPFSSPQVVSIFVTDPISGNGRNQGGQSSCGVPFFAGTGVALNFTVVPLSGSGDLKVYPFGGTVPNTSIINFTAGQNLANAASTSIALDPTNELSIKIEFAASVHIIVDIMGYYSAPTATALDVIEVRGSGVNVGLNQGFTADSPSCPAGRTLTGGGFDQSDIDGVLLSRSTSNGPQWEVAGRAISGATTVYAIARCARVPGR